MDDQNSKIDSERNQIY